MTQPTVLDLFAGYGGFSLAFDLAGFRTIAFSEIDPYASAVLAHRFPSVPNLGDVRGVTRDRVFDECGTLPTVVTGGFPCQPHSLAGKRNASADERDLWDECVRVLRDLRPEYALFENVSGLFTSESGAFFNRILSDLAAIGYACSWETLSAADVGAPHRRDRVWLLCVDELADAGGVRHDGRAVPHGVDAGWVPQLSQRGAARGEVVGRGERGAVAFWPARPGQPQHGWEPPRVVGDPNGGRREQRHEGVGGVSVADAAGRAVGGLADAERIGRDGGTDRIGGRQRESAEAQGLGALRDDSGQAQPQLGRDADGPAHRLDAVAAQVQQAQEGDAVNRTHRLKAIGNGIVPLCALPFALAIRRILTETPQ